jgi:hypothetical protein
MRIYLSFTLFLFFTLASFAQLDKYPLAKKRLGTPQKQNFVHYKDCSVYEFTPDRNNNDTVLIESFDYENGKLNAELRGDFEGENEYHIDKSSTGGNYLKKYFYHQNGNIEREESYYSRINESTWTLYYYDKNNLLTKTEEWHYHAKSVPIAKTAEGRVIFGLSETEFTWRLQSQYTFAYNDKKQLTEKRYYFSDLTRKPYEVYTYTYDSLNRMKTETMRGQILSHDYKWIYYDWGYEKFGNYNDWKSKYVYETDEKGRIRRQWWDSGEGNGWIRVVNFYNYDSKDRIVQESVYNYNKELEVVHWYRYQE